MPIEILIGNLNASKPGAEGNKKRTRHGRVQSSNT